MTAMTTPERFTPRLHVHPPASLPVRILWATLGWLVVAGSIAAGVIEAWLKECGL